MNFIRPLAAALNFLTLFRIPLKTPDAELGQRSIWFYSLVGAAVGGLLMGVIRGIRSASVGSPELVALGVLLAYTVVTSGLPVTCLGLVLDANFGPGSLEERLKNFRSRQIGPLGVTVIVLALLAKWQLYLSAIANAEDFWPLIVCSVSRWAMALAAWGTRPIEGNQAEECRLRARWPDVLVSGLPPLAISLKFYGVTAIAFLIIAALVATGVRICSIRRMGVLTPEALHAVVEPVELALLSLLFFGPMLLR